MADLINHDFRALYQDTLELVRTRGRQVAPRGLHTLELPAATLQLTGLNEGRAALPLGIGRKAHPGIAASARTRNVSCMATLATSAAVATPMPTHRSVDRYNG